MSRHLRNLAFFAVGWLLAFVAVPAFASYPTVNAPLDAPITIGAGGRLQPASIPKPGDFSVTGVSYDSGGSKDWIMKRFSKAAYEGSKYGKMNADLIQRVITPKSAFATAFKGLVKGPVAAVAGTLLADYLIQKGWEWMDNSQSYLVPKPIYKDSFDTSYSPCKGKGYDLDQMISCANAAAFNYYGGLVKPSSYPIGQWFTIYARDNGSMGISVISSRTQVGTQKNPATDSDIDTLVNDFIEQDKQRAVDLAKEKKLPLPLSPGDPDLEASPQKQSSPKSQPTTSTTSNPDGSTEQKDCYLYDTLEFTPTGYIRTYNNYTCVTTGTTPQGQATPPKTETTTKPTNPSTGFPVDQPNQPSQPLPPPSKTDCEINPNAVGCLELGDTPTPDDLKTEEVPLSFSYSPLSLPQQCPQPQNLNLSVGNVAVEWDAFCTFASGIRPFVIGLAFLSAVLFRLALASSVTPILSPSSTS